MFYFGHLFTPKKKDGNTTCPQSLARDFVVRSLRTMTPVRSYNLSFTHNVVLPRIITLVRDTLHHSVEVFTSTLPHFLGSTLSLNVLFNPFYLHPTEAGILTDGPTHEQEMYDVEFK